MCQTAVIIGSRELALEPHVPEVDTNNPVFIKIPASDPNKVTDETSRGVAEVP